MSVTHGTNVFLNNASAVEGGRWGAAVPLAALPIKLLAWIYAPIFHMSNSQARSGTMAQEKYRTFARTRKRKERRKMVYIRDLSRLSERYPIYLVVSLRKLESDLVLRCWRGSNGVTTTSRGDSSDHPTAFPRSSHL